MIRKTLRGIVVDSQAS